MFSQNEFISLIQFSPRKLQERNDMVNRRTHDAEGTLGAWGLDTGDTAGVVDARITEQLLVFFMLMPRLSHALVF